MTPRWRDREIRRVSKNGRRIHFLPRNLNPWATERDFLSKGRVSGAINVRDVIAKKRGRRRIPMRPDLRRALERLAQSREPVGPIIRSYRGSHLKTNSVVN
jgi:integrase